MSSPLATAIAGIQQASEADPANAAVLVRAVGGSVTHTEQEFRTGKHRVRLDQPAGFTGEDKAPGPVEYALISLASCQVASAHFWGAKLGIEVDEVEVEAEADVDLRGFLGFDESVRSGFTGVRLNVTIKGPESAERYEELQAAVEAHCPVLDLFANPTPVTTTLAQPVG